MLGVRQGIPTGIVGPTHWDDAETVAGSERFDLSYYRERRYLRSLRPELPSLVKREVDWALFGRWGYAPVDS